MTSEKRYELVCNMLRSYDAISGGTMNAAEQVIREPQKWTGTTYFPFYADAAQMLLDAREEMDKKATGTGRMAAIKRVYKSTTSMSRKDMSGAFRSADRWAICDGYRFIRLNSKPESIPECAGGIDLDKCIPQCACDGEIVSLPSVSEIKAEIADLKSKYGKDWARHPMEALPGWWCNAQYLLDMVQAIPDGIAHRPEKCSTPLYYRAESGEDAMLLPVRHTEEQAA